MKSPKQKKSIEELTRLDSEKKELVYQLEEVANAMNILEKMKGVDYVVELLVEEYKRIKADIEDIHHEMFG